MTTQPLPSRFSERAFRRYEAAITAVVANWPAVTTFEPKPLSLETFSCRFRDALTSFADHQWSPTSVDMDKFVKVCPEIVVSISAVPGRVAIGPYDQLKKRVPLGEGVVTTAEQVIPKIHIVEPSRELAHAIIVMHHYRILTEPSVVETTCHSIIDAAAYDVAVHQEGNVFTIL